MKPLSLTLALALSAPLLWGKAHLLSPLPLPFQEMIDIDSQLCDEACLQALDERGWHFSFMARFHGGIESEELRARLAILMEEQGVDSVPFYGAKKSRAKLNIALIVPKKIIGRYSISTIDTILAYLLAQEGAFSFEVFDSQDEQGASLESALKSAESKGFDYGIALVTHQGAQEIARLNHRLPLYIPSVHRDQLEGEAPLSPRLLFGGIDYEAQVKALAKNLENPLLTLYNDDSYTGQRIGEYVRNLNLAVGFEESFSNAKAASFSQEVKRQFRHINGATIFLNTPIVKSSLILSQFTYHALTPEVILSTQINYNHSLLSLTQTKDRERLYVASSIGKAAREIIEYSSILQSDLQYDWINYSTALGVERFYRTVFPEATGYFHEKLQGNQVDYTTTIYWTTPERFIPVEIP